MIESTTKTVNTEEKMLLLINALQQSIYYIFFINGMTRDSISGKLEK